MRSQKDKKCNMNLVSFERVPSEKYVVEIFYLDVIKPVDWEFYGTYNLLIRSVAHSPSPPM